MNTLKFASLGSGSRGNGTVIKSQDTTLLLDCGWSKRETIKRLDRLGVQPNELDGIFVTHLHSDHAKGIGVFTRKYEIPVYTSNGTMYGRGDLVDSSLFHSVCGGDRIVVGDISISAVSVPHDCHEPLQFVFEHHGKRLGILTDIGSVLPHVTEAYQDCDTLFIECNHDLSMLWNGPYPAQVKRRIAGDFGHLNNEQSLDFINSVRQDRLDRVIVGHISEENNSIDLLKDLFQHLSEEISMTYATQDYGSAWINVGSSS